MSKIKTHMNKVWILAAGAAIITASSATMAFALDNNIPENASTNVVSYANVSKENSQTQAANVKITSEYKVVDLSKQVDITQLKDELTHKLVKGATPEQIDEKAKAILANMVPGDKDITADQAAAYAAALLEKAYGVDLTGYTAEASFARNPVPGNDNWGVVFHAPKGDDNSKRYLASVNSVNGTMNDLVYSDPSYRVGNNQNLQDPSWKTTAEADVAKLMPENVSITGSKVVAATPEAGVSIVSELSNGSAYAVRLTGEDKEAAAIGYFPNGYDGSWDFNPVAANARG